MTYRLGQINEWGTPILSASSAAVGASITPGNNAYGSYVQLLSGAQVTDDCFALDLNLNTISVSGSARDCLAKLGLDPAGGTSFVDTWLDILCSCASPIGGSGTGVTYRSVPLRVPKGWSVGVAMAVNNATVGTGAAKVTLYRQPSHPELMPRSGTFVRTFGTTLASSSGTAITPNGSGGKSAWVQCGSAAAEQLWAICLGVGCNNAAMSNNPTAFNMGIGSSTTVNRQVGGDIDVSSGTAETLTWQAEFQQALINSGDLLFARAGGPAAFNTGASVAIYAVGG